MKKLILVPTVLACATPLISMVGCSGTQHTKTFNLTNYYKKPQVGVAFYCEGVDLSPGTTCIVNIDTEPHSAEISDSHGWNFGIVDDIDGAPSCDIATASVNIDGHDLDQINPGEGYPADNQFLITEHGEVASYLDGGAILDGSHQITINFTVKQAIKNKVLAFWIILS